VQLAYIEIQAEKIQTSNLSNIKPFKRQTFQTLQM